ncbi:MAG TPA: SurA N-terminal domain-containing protein [Terriglobia bacterium]|nr:SurA N-terminal domain-containing protein [Terriglobia bacterium]
MPIRNAIFRKLRLLALAAAILGALAALSCSRSGSGSKAVWAFVDGTPIYAGQVEAEYRRRLATLPDAAKSEQALSFKLSILNELIDRQLLLERARSLQITVPDSEVETRLNQIRSPYSDQDFRKRLADQHLTVGALRRRVQEDLILQKLVQQEITSRVVVTPQEISDYYARNKSDFKVLQAEVHLAQILVTPVKDPLVRNLMNDDARNVTEAQRKIRALYALLRSGEDFAKVAQEYSEDPRTAPGGGDMGFVPVSSFASDRIVRNALKPLKAGQFTGILRDGANFRIIKLLGRVPAGQRPLSDPQVAGSIRQTLTNEKEEVLKAAMIEDLRNRAHVQDNLAEEIVKDAGSAQAIH